MAGGGAMSCNVLVIPEDPIHNGYILRPLLQAIFALAGKPRAKIKVLENPRFTGYDTAIRSIRLELWKRYSFVDYWVFLPDADRASAAAMQALERDLEQLNVNLFCCPAQPEVEIYACVPYRAEMGIPWDQARSHPSFKEDIFEPLLARHGDPDRAGKGRDLMIQEALANTELLLRLCPELRTLHDRIAARIAAEG